jgi:PKD repeat protein
MKNITSVAILSILFHLSLIAQCEIEWTRTFGGPDADGGKSVCQTSDGGFIIAGYTFSSSSGGSDVYLVKADSMGNEQWTKTIGGVVGDYGNAVYQTSDGGYLVAGSTSSFGNGSEDLYLIKTDQNGTVLWTQTYGGLDADEGRSLCQTSDGGFAICGYIRSIGTGQDDLWVMKIDSTGESLWSTPLGGTEFEKGMAIREIANGNLIVIGATGSTAISSSNSDFYLINIQANGVVNWERAFGTLGSLAFDWGNDVCQTLDGNFLAVGNSNTGSPMDMYAIKISADGNKLWANNYGHPFYDYANSVCALDDGGFLICGAAKVYETGKNDIYLIKIDSLGNKLWEEQFGGSGNDWGSVICKTRDGGFVMVGRTDSYGAGSTDVYLMKLRTLSAQFHGEPCMGTIPLNVNFHDLSVGGATSWEWDFDNDGTIDSYEQNPVWTYNDEGIYTVELTVSNGFETKTLRRENYVQAVEGIRVQYQPGWNLISLPFVPDSTISFPSLFSYTHGYQPSGNLTNGRGYWARPAGEYLYKGSALVVDTIDVVYRWNIVGSISTPVPASSLNSIPSGIVTSNFFGYDIDSGYTSADTLKPGRGYWVKMNQAGKLILSRVPVISPANRIKIVADMELPPPPPLVPSSRESQPVRYALGQNFPNPFNPTTRICYELPAESKVNLTIFNVLGQPIKTLVDDIQSSGVKSIELNAATMVSGLYFYRLNAVDVTNPASSISQTMKMLLVK